jgi:ATP-dependent protease HslVU (ClpYQ) peptidase subunit
MSIIVAVQKDGAITIAADTMHATGAHREHPDNVEARSKLRPLGRSFIGGVGWAVYDNILEHYIQSIRKPPLLRDPREVFDFFLKFWQVMRKRYQLVNDQPERDDHSPFANLDSEFLVVNDDGIYHVASDLSVMKFAKYVAIGAGDKYAYGALHALYDSKLTVEQIARSATAAAIHFDQTCGGDVEVFNLRMKTARRKTTARRN